jgi:hypothetical protein
MTYKALSEAFHVLESQLGLRRTKDDPLILENETHKVSVMLLERHSTVSCDLVLKSLPESAVDAYSIIAFYHSQALNTFFSTPEERTDEVVANFIARELSGSCAAVFQIVGTTEWMSLHQHHLRSLRRRNDAFWARVSGFDEGNDLSECATY